MRRGSLIDDVLVDDTHDFGPPICFENFEIRKMLRLAHATSKDVLYDLGSGWGQILIVALTEFNLKKVVGFENQAHRRRKSLERLQKWSEFRKDITRDRWDVLPYNFDKLLKGEIGKKKAALEEATVIFYGLETTSRDTKRIERIWKNAEERERRLVYYHNCLFPEIMPNKIDLPFLSSDFPFTHTSDKMKWLEMITGKMKSSLGGAKQPSETELWDELRHDYDKGGEKDDVQKYRRRLNAAVKRTKELLKRESEVRVIN